MSDSVRPHRWHPTGSSIPGILQARILEWVAISFSITSPFKGVPASLVLRDYELVNINQPRVGGKKTLNHYRENNGCYDRLFCIHTPLPSTTFSSNLRALSLGSVSTMGPQPRHLLRGFSSGSSHLLPGSLNFLSGSSFSSPSV